MYFQELSQLQKKNPSLSQVISRLDTYLYTLPVAARVHINASDTAQAIEEHRQQVISLLMAATQLGLLKLKFRINCPVHGHGIRDFSDLSELPPELYCDVCDERHPVTTDDVEYFFELPTHPIAIAR